MIEKLDLNLMRFKTEGEAEQAIMDLTSGLQSPFWQFVCKVIDQNLAELQDELNEREGLSTAENDSLKMRIKFLKRLKSIPTDQLAALKPDTNSDDGEDEDDPYATKPTPAE